MEQEDEGLDGRGGGGRDGRLDLVEQRREQQSEHDHRLRLARQQALLLDRQDERRHVLLLRRAVVRAEQRHPHVVHRRQAALVGRLLHQHHVVVLEVEEDRLKRLQRGRGHGAQPLGDQRDGLRQLVSEDDASRDEELLDEVAENGDQRGGRGVVSEGGDERGHHRVNLCHGDGVVVQTLDQERHVHLEGGNAEERVQRGAEHGHTTHAHLLFHVLHHRHRHLRQQRAALLFQLAQRRADEIDRCDVPHVLRALARHGAARQRQLLQQLAPHVIHLLLRGPLRQLRAQVAVEQHHGAVERLVLALHRVHRVVRVHGTQRRRRARGSYLVRVEVLDVNEGLDVL